MISQTNDYVDRLEVSTNENTEEGEGIGSLIEEGNSEIQTAAEPTAKVLNSDAEFE